MTFFSVSFWRSFICALTVGILTVTILKHRSPGSLGSVILAAEKTRDARC